MKSSQLIVGILLFVTVSVNCQKTVYTFNQLTGVDHLISQKYNNYLFKDSKGFVWIGSAAGMNRYDGVSIKQYLPFPEDETALRGPYIQSHLFEDNEGFIWFSTFKFIHRYDPEKDQFSSRKVNSIDEGYRIYFIDKSKEIIISLVGDSLYCIPFDESQKPINLGAFSETHMMTKRLWGESKSHHFFFNPKQKHLELFKFSKAKIKTGNFEKLEFDLLHRPLSVYFENEERIWFGTTDGLLLLNSKTGQQILFDKWKEKKINDVIGVHKIAENRFLVSTQNSGFYVFEKDFGFKEQIFWNDRGQVAPFSKPLEQVYVDQDHTIWASVAGEGIFFTNLNKPKFKANLFEETNASLNLNIIRGIAQDSSGKIWCLSNNGVVLLNSDGSKNREQKFIEKKVFSKGELFHIFCDKENRIWVASNEGLFVLHPNAENFKEVKNDICRSFMKIFQLHDGRIVSSTLKEGIVEVFEESENEFSVKYFNDFKKRDGFTCFFEDQFKNLFVAKPLEGIYLPVKEGQFLDPYIKIPTTSTVHGMVEDETHQIIWVATSNGLMKLDRETLTLKQERKFPRYVLNAILKDDSGNLWLSSNNGLYKYNPQAGEYQHFTHFDGLQNLEFNFWSALKANDGKFFFGSMNGINFFDPSEVSNQVAAAKPTITKIKIEEEEFERMLLKEHQESVSVSQLNNIPELPYFKKNISFSLAQLEYSAPSQSGFKYQLKGYDKTPISVTGESEAVYKNLNPGSYQFEVFAINSDGELSKDKSTINFRIAPPWWETWWFYLLVTTTILGVAYFIYKRRIRQITQKAAYETQIAEDKKQKAEMKTQIAENKMAALRAQMNPHFIFNSLNSINSYILNNDIRQASIYVGKFSKLMRMILNLSEFPIISLEKEIEMLKLYMEVEQLRFKKPFEFEFDIDEDEVDPFDTEVPTMLLQPFVENSIWHGLAAKEEGIGKITIQMTSENDLLKCVVKDNGIGRAAAAKIKGQKGRAHKSKALDIVKDRLRILHANQEANHTINIIDLEDHNGTPSGTAVEIVLPLYYDQ